MGGRSGMLTTFHPGSSNHIFHYNFHTVIFLPPVIFPHKSYRNSTHKNKNKLTGVRDPSCAIHKKGCDSWDLAWDPQSRSNSLMKLLTSCTEQCHDMALRGNTFFPPVLPPITAFFFRAMPAYLAGRDWSSSVKSFRPGMVFGQLQLQWLQLHYFLKSGAEDPHSDFNQSAHEEEEGRARHDCG